MPDVPAIDNLFDYTVPPAWEDDGRSASLEIGSRVRIELHGRRVGGWIVGLDVEPPPGVGLLPLAKSAGHGPSGEVIELARWIAHRWASSPVKVLRSASPPRNVPKLPPPQTGPAVHVSAGDVADGSDWITEAFTGDGAVLRIGPAGDRWPVVEAAIRLGNPLFLVPTLATAHRLGGRLSRAGHRPAVLPDAWAQAAAGAIAVGTRSAAVARVHEPGAIVVLDEHDESFQETRTPTWHAREVAIERAKRFGIPCVLVSPTPTLDATEALPLRTPGRQEEFQAWPAVEAIDRRGEPPGRLGLFSPRLVDELRSSRRVGCVLNRKGRAQLLACDACGELAACERCESAVRQSIGDLECRQCELVRPVICQACGGLKLKNLRMGVSRAREEIEALIGEAVTEVTASDRGDDTDTRVVVGTEALLRPGASFDTIAFLDFDQELLALRQRAGEQAFALVGRAARIVGSRANGGRVLVQTRSPDHAVVRAAILANPSIAADAERERRLLMGWPPFSAEATVSGQAAATFIERLGSPLGIEVRGPSDGAWLVRADDAATLADCLAAVPRPDGRLRIEVDPLRV